MLRIDAVKALQQRWQAEAHRVPVDRRHEQKLWDAFRKPIDEAFNRKTQDREKAASALGEHDRAVLEASKALEAANAKGEAGAIRNAIAALEAAIRGQTQAADRAASATAVAPATDAAAPAFKAESTEGAQAAADAPVEGEAAAESAEAAAPVVVPKPVKPVVAMRGDDRPGMRKSEPAAPTRGGRPGERGDARGPRPDARDGARPSFGDRGPRFGDRPPMEDRGPRLGDAAFRAQRDALERAEFALKKLAAQAHGEALTQLLTAWEKRDAALVPSAQELGPRVAAPVRSSWIAALGAEPKADAAVAQSLLRLEMAAELPTPAEHLGERRMLQLQLLTQRRDPGPAQTWGQDAARVLASPFDEARARRVQNVLKALLKR
jgi:hypothetical protein